MLADDHVVVRRALRMLLARQADMEVVAEVGSGDEALAMALAERPGVLVLDLNMPGRPALEVLAELAGMAPEIATVILTMEQDPEMARQALSLGARGYLAKQSVEDELLTAIRKAIEGEAYIASEMRAAMDRFPPEDGASEPLTKREREVLRLVALGHTNPEIAAMLGISARTVESHRMHITQAVDLPTRPDLVRYAIDKGLI